jgi:hypothetical protein
MHITQASLAVSGPNIFCGGSLITDRFRFANYTDSTHRSIVLIYSLSERPDFKASLTNVLTNVLSFTLQNIAPPHPVHRLHEKKFRVLSCIRKIKIENNKITARKNMNLHCKYWLLLLNFISEAFSF